MSKLKIVLIVWLAIEIAAGAIGCAERAPATLTPTPTSTPNQPTTTPVLQPPVGFLIYSDNVNKFSIFYPNDWEIMPTENISYALVGFWDRQPNATMNSFVVMKADLPYKMDVSTYFDSEKGYFPSDYQNYAPISTDTLILNGKKAIKHTWTLTYDGIARENVRLYMVDNKTSWCLEGSCYEESFNSYKNTYDTMMSGFHTY